MSMLAIAQTYLKENKLIPARYCLHQALSTEPVQAAYALAALAYVLGQGQSCEHWLNRLFQLAPEHREGRLLLAQLKTQRQQYQEALSLLQDIAKIHPQKEILFQIGQLQTKIGDYKSALKIFYAYQQQQPESSAALHEISKIFRQLRQYTMATQILKQALQRAPQNMALWLSLADCFLERGQAESALATCLRAQKQVHSPEDAQHFCYYFYYAPSWNDRRLLNALQTQGRQAQAKPPCDITTVQVQAQHKLRVAYLSHELGHSSTSRLLEPILAHHSTEFEIFLYDEPLNQSPDDQRMRQQLRQYPCTWRSVDLKQPQEYLQQLHQDQIDIVVDLNGFHSPRHELLSLLNDVIRVSGLGFLFNAGLAPTDYCLLPQALCPPDLALEFAEHIVYLPTTLALQLPDQPCSTPPALDRGYITFGSANAPRKYNDQVIALWSRVVKAVPQARLLLKNPAFHSEELVNELRQRFAAQGLTSERLHFQAKHHQSSLEHNIQFYSEIDIALDPFPAQGGLTSIDALWAGVPILTYLNPDWRCRALSCALYEIMGQAEWICQSPEAYIAQAQAWAGDLDFLAAQRQALPQTLKNSAIWDLKAFVKQLEKSYQWMYANSSKFKNA